MYRRSHHREIRGNLRSKYVRGPIQILLDDKEECARLLKLPSTYRVSNHTFLEAILTSYPNYYSLIPEGCKNQLPVQLREGYFTKQFGKTPMYRNAPVNLSKPRKVSLYEDDRAKPEHPDVCPYDVVDELAARAYGYESVDEEEERSEEDADDYERDGFVVSDEEPIVYNTDYDGETEDDDDVLDELVDTDTEEYRQACEATGVYHVREILDSRVTKRGKQVEYLVSWHGYPDAKYNTWEPYKSLPADLVEKYEEDVQVKLQAPRKRLRRLLPST